MKWQRSYKTLSNERAVAIVTVLAIITIASALVAVVLYFATRGTEVSALQRRYESAREASYGALDVLTKEIISQGLSGTNLSAIVGGFSSITTATVTSGTTDTCFSSKLLNSTANWDASCSSSLDPKGSPDIRFTLSGTSSGVSYNVYTKIVDTVQGNSDRSGVSLEGTGVAEGQSGMITIQHFPYLYRINIQGENAASPAERANIEVLYAY